MIVAFGKKVCASSVIGAPHIADEELYLQAFFPGNVPPIISQMALGPIRENVEDPALFRINQNALIFTGRSIAFEFVNGKRLWKLVRRRIGNRVQKAQTVWTEHR